MRLASHLSKHSTTGGKSYIPSDRFGSDEAPLTQTKLSFLLAPWHFTLPAWSDYTWVWDIYVNIPSRCIHYWKSASW